MCGSRKYPCTHTTDGYWKFQFKVGDWSQSQIFQRDCELKFWEMGTSNQNTFDERGMNI